MVKITLVQENPQLRALEALGRGYPKASLDLSTYKEILTDDLLLPILINFGIHLKKLNIDDCKKLTAKTPDVIAKYCSQLLELSTKNMLWKSWGSKGFFWSTSFPNLEFINVSGCSDLRWFHIDAPKLKNPHKIAKPFHALLQRWLGSKNQFKKYISININGTPIDGEGLIKFYAESVYMDLKNNDIEVFRITATDSIWYIKLLQRKIIQNNSLKTISLCSKSLSLGHIRVLIENLTHNT